MTNIRYGWSQTNVPTQGLERDFSLSCQKEEEERPWQVCDPRAYMQSAPRWPATTHGNRLLRRPSQLSLPTSAREKTDVEASDVEDPNFQKVPTSNFALQFVGGGANYKKKTWDTFLWFFWTLDIGCSSITQPSLFYYTGINELF